MPLSDARIRASPRLHAVVFCWPGKKANALHIAQSLVDHVERVTVIDACSPKALPQVPENRRFEWHQVPTTFFYGGKFRVALDVFDGDFMLQIQADATAVAWAEVAEACRSAFASTVPVGVWAADVDFTLFPTRDVTLYREPTLGLNIVSQTDCIVWALSTTVIERLEQFPFEENTLGWGVDLAAIAIAYALRRVAVRDQRVQVAHPRSRGYDSDEAGRQAERFLASLDPVERAIHEMLKASSQLRGMGLQGLIEQNRAVLRRQIEKRLLRRSKRLGGQRWS